MTPRIRDPALHFESQPRRSCSIRPVSPFSTSVQYPCVMAQNQTEGLSVMETPSREVESNESLGGEAGSVSALAGRRMVTAALLLP